MRYELINQGKGRKGPKGAKQSPCKGFELTSTCSSEKPAIASPTIGSDNGR